MGKELKTVFQRALLGIERAQGDRNVLEELLNNRLVGEVLALPEQEVPKDLRAFFEEWQRRAREIEEKSKSIEETELPPGASTEQAQNYLNEAKAFVEDLKKFKVWLVSNAPAIMPNEIVTAAQIVLNDIISEYEEVVEQCQIMIDFVKTSGLNKR